MKLLVVLSLVALAVARPEPPAYGAPSFGGSSGGFGFSSGGGGFGGSSGDGGFGGSSGGGGFGGGSGGGQGGQVFRHVYVHTAPDDAEDSQSRVIRVPGGQNKHVNIIFVKAPSSSSSQQTEVILPEQDEHKNLVYVLLKKGDASSDIKIRRPAAPAQSKPDVYFIRYKNQEGGSSGGGSTGGSSSGGYSSPSGPSSQYGASF